MLLRTSLLHRFSGLFYFSLVSGGGRGEALGGTSPFRQRCTETETLVEVSVLRQRVYPGVYGGVYTGVYGGVQGGYTGRVRIDGAQGSLFHKIY